MDREKKEQFAIVDPKRAWETIEEMIFNDQDMTIEELDEELREYGTEPDDSVKRLFELAQKIVREAGPGERVSPYVSDILSQLAAKYYRSEPKSNAANATDPSKQGSTGNNDNVTNEAKPKARAAVLSFHRNYKEETPNDKAIRENNEKRLQERAEKLKQRKKRDQKK